MKMLEVEIQDRPDGVGAAVRGELDLSTVEQLEQELESPLERAPAVLVLDLRGLDFLDSSGLRLLLRLHALQREADRRLVIVNNRRPVARVFELTGAAEELEVVGDPDQI